MSRSKAAATAQAVPSPRAPERRNGPGRVYAPHFKRSEEGQGPGGGSRDALLGHVPDASSSPGSRCATFLPRRRCATCRRLPARPAVCRVRTAGGDQRRSVAQIEVTVPSVPILDVAVPQVVDQLVEVFKHFDIECLVQVIDVPKIILEDIPGWSSWWRCPCQSPSSWRAARTSLAQNGASTWGRAGPTGVWGARPTPGGNARLGSPPALGGI